MCGLLFFSAVTSVVLMATVEFTSGANPLDLAMITLKGEKLNEKHYCVSYAPAVKEIKKEKEAVFRPLVSLVNDSECNYEKRGLEGKVAMVEHCSNDTNDEIIIKLKSAKASGAIILVAPKRKAKEIETTITKVDIEVVFLPNKTGYEIAKYDTDHNSTLYVKLFSRPPPFDWSFGVIWIIAVFTVVCGSFWAGLVQHAEYQSRNKCKSKKKGKPVAQLVQRSSEADVLKTCGVPMAMLQEKADFTESGDDADDDFSVPISAKIVIMFVIHMCVMLLMLYYFFRYLVYVIMFLFAMSSSAALVACLDPLARRINIGTRRVPKILASCCQAPLEIRDVVVLCVGFSVGITWMVIRHHEYAWVLQDILGIAFCINMLKGIHLPNLKMLCLLLVLLLVYDVFFVFITPLLSATRESVMVEVARGGSSSEQLPMVIKFPRLNHNKFEICMPMKFSILGLGDILAPGLLISYCHAFDLLALGTRYYFYVGCVGYAVGMVVTFCALHLMRSAQPALLYLVPCTIIPTALVAYYRGHLYSIWNGVRLSSTAASAPKPLTVKEHGGANKEEEGEPKKPHDPLIKGDGAGGSRSCSEAELLQGTEPDRETPVKTHYKKNKKANKGRTLDAAAPPAEGTPAEHEGSICDPLGSPASPSGDRTPFLEPIKLRDIGTLDAEPEVVPSTSRRKAPGLWDGCSTFVTNSHGNALETLAEPPFPVPL
ncbi:signal peptide peptidase-like 2A [Ornithodoros turicata]|uniref:signal peptide peptidase-like 2A n=1 Tax=Ornithodoros turicata TaxID=34597 RepID=UPI003138F7E3